MVYFTSLRALCGIALALAVPAAAQTVAYYRFNEGPNGATINTIFDSGPNGLNGTAQGSNPLKYTSKVAPFPTTGGFALDASGDYNYVSVPHSPAMVVQGSLTVEAFVRPNSPYDGTNYDNGGDHIVSKQNTTNGGDHLAAWQIQYIANTGVFLCGIGFTNSTGVYLLGTKDIRDGNWHHVAMVLNRNAPNVGQSLTLYVDGVQEAVTTGNWPNLVYGAQPLFIGAGNAGGGGATGIYRRNFGGLIDEVRITAAALSPDEFLNVTTISGTLLFVGIAAAAPSQNVTFELRPTDGSGNITRTISVLPTGAFNLSAFLKNYIIHIKPDKYLATNVNADVTKGSVSGLKVKLQAGDANNDNSCDTADFGILVGAYGSDSSVSGSGYDATADFNGDGVVDTSDFALLVGEYGAVGDQ